MTVPRSFITHRNKRAIAFNKDKTIDDKALMRADCELYEYHMERENLWEGSQHWSYDGVSDKYGKVDVKVIDKWWNLPIRKAWNVFRQQGIIDHFYFIEKIDWPDRPLKTGDTVKVGFIGVMTFNEVCSKIEVSKIPRYGYYVDVKKHSHH